jgi:N-acetylmuramoyl-L-alanine amidase
MSKIVIDPGHGGSDPGASANGIIEKNWALDMARRVGKHLTDGWECVVEYTRSSDRFIEVTERGRMAERMEAQAFLSLHNNAFTSASANGFETFRYSSGKAHDRALQNAVHDSVMGFLRGHGITDRGKKSANFGVLRTSNNIPSILIEYLFLTNAREAGLLKQASFADGLAKATAEGVAAFLKLKKKAKQDYSHLNPAPNGAKFTRNLERRIPQMEGDDILAVQQKLGVDPVVRKGKPVGIFGPKTEAAVKEYQKKHGLVVDGWVGPITWASMFGRKEEKPAPKPPPRPFPEPRPTKLIRVVVNGKQQHAFAERESAERWFRETVKEGDTVEIKR